jgi:spore coat protein A
MRTKPSLNLPAGSYELPLILYDRIFDHDGQLFYPVSPIPEHPWMDEVAGDAMVVNGRVQPFHEVEPRRYRLRVLNAANGRFFRLGLSNGAGFLQIGADQGLLPAPVRLTTLLLAPGERADLIVDFATMRGERVTLTNGAFQMMQFRVGSAPAQDRVAYPKLCCLSPACRDFCGAHARTDAERVQGSSPATPWSCCSIGRHGTCR